MKKKVTFEGFQCDACGKLLPYNYAPYKFKVKMSGPDGCIKKDKLCLCFGCSQSMTNMIDEWYERKYFEREKNKEKVKAMLAEEKE
jgi:hypothetical protein